MRALIVDDSGVTRKILAQFLQGMNYEVFEATDGKQALDQLEQTPDIDIAMVDWSMPVMNGIDFVRSVRNRGLNGLKLMMVTMEQDVDQIQEALQAGADEFLMKPFTYEGLQEKLALVVGEGK